MKKNIEEVYADLNHEFEMCLNSMIRSAQMHHLNLVDEDWYELKGLVKAAYVFGELTSTVYADLIIDDLFETKYRIWREYN